MDNAAAKAAGFDYNDQLIEDAQKKTPDANKALWKICCGQFADRYAPRFIRMELLSRSRLYHTLQPLLGPPQGQTFNQVFRSSRQGQRRKTQSGEQWKKEKKIQ